MRAYRSLASLALIILSTAGSAPTGVQEIEIVHKGCFHGHEVSAQSEGEWEALYRRGDAFVLVPCRVRVTPCHDDISDAPGEKTGREVVVDSDGTPLFLVRGLGSEGAAPTTIPTAWSGEQRRYVRPGERLGLVLDRSEYRLTAQGEYDPTRPRGDRLVLSYRLKLIGPKGQSQDLPAPARFAEDGVPTLVWAGDLDRDGKLDLYMDMTDHYNVRNYVLLLSSRAGTGQLVKQVASRRYVGC